jgi:hypothetical protein
MCANQLANVVDTYLSGIKRIEDAILDLNEFLGGVKPKSEAEQALVEAFESEVEPYLNLVFDSATQEQIEQ